MNMQPVRYGIIGAGRMGGYTMLDLMSNHPAARAIAFCEIEPERADTAERLKQIAAIGIERCDSLQQLLGRDDLDVILNVTPHYAHVETVLEAMKAGQTVICEKPPAMTPADCQALIEAASPNPRRLMVHFQHLLRPSAQWLKQEICNGTIGAIRRVRCSSLWWRATEYYGRVPWGGRRCFNGKPCLDGTLVNQSIHFLNQMLALAHQGGMDQVAVPRTIQAALYRFHPAEALEMEDTAVLCGQLDTPDKTEFTFAATTCATQSAGSSSVQEYHGLDQHLVVIEGDRGLARWDGSGRASIEIPNQPRQIFAQDEGPWPFYFHVQRVLAGEEEPRTPVAQSCNTMKAIFAAYEAAGDNVKQAPWECLSQIPGVLGRCVHERVLPARLAQPPSWA